MTVSTEVDHNEYTGNGVTTSFPYTFRVFKESDLVVQVVDLDENIAVLALDTDYTVTGAGGYNGGNVILSKALANGYQISISRELPVTQETDLRNQGKFFAEVHEDAFDKLTMLIQQVRSWFSLALRKPSFVANYYNALNNYIRNLKDPVNPQDASTKNYVDSTVLSNIDHTIRVPDSYIDPLPPLAQLEGSIIGIANGKPVPLPVPSGTAADVFNQLASSADGKGDSLVAVKQPYLGSLPRTQHEKNADVIDLRDFVDIFDGSDMSDGVQSALDAAEGRTLKVPGGGSKVGISRTMYIRAGTKIECEGKYDNWDYSPNTGFRFITIGNGNPQRWTDITGNDLADDTPMFVACGNGVVIGQGVTLITEINNWSIGVFFPCVKQCAFYGQAFGFTDGCVYLDATWSDRNLIMKNIHPEVKPSTGMNEFHMDFAWCIASGSGFGIKIQGTTRPGTIVENASEWLWGWGGTSDIRINNSRLSGTGVDGGSFSHDCQLFGEYKYGQGVTVRDCALRTSGNAKYSVKLDRSNRIIFDGVYSETVGNIKQEFAITSRTKKNADGIFRINDKITSVITVDGVETSASSSNAPWNETRCVYTITANGKIWMPTFEGGIARSRPIRITSFSSGGDIIFCSDDGESRSENAILTGATFRGVRPGELSVGSSTFPCLKVTSKSGTIGSVDLREDYIHPTIPNSIACGTPMFPWSGGATQTAFSVTSDENAKGKPLEITDEILDAWSEVEFYQYQFLDRIEAKGADNARWHVGIIAQRAKAAFEKHGVDPTSFAFFCFDEEKTYPAIYETLPAEYDNEGNLIKDERSILVSEEVTIPARYSIRYEEALILEAALNRRELKRQKDIIDEIMRVISTCEFKS